MKKLVALTCIILLTACSAPRYNPVDLLRDQGFVDAVKSPDSSCGSSRRRGNLYPGQEVVHSVSDCVIIMAYIVADYSSVEYEAAVLRITNGIYPTTSKAGGRSGVNSGDMFVVGAIVGAASGTSAPQQNQQAGGICVLNNSYVSGFNKVCQYTCGVNAYATTIPSTSICPMRP